ncbi:hypothetical protein TNCV_2090871 [Trichonephila clavipes]|nr:hypothetical protein TNCV_2090871 [Trichonephila clavipes]
MLAEVMMIRTMRPTAATGSRTEAISGKHRRTNPIDCSPGRVGVKQYVQRVQSTSWDMYHGGGNALQSIKVLSTILHEPHVLVSTASTLPTSTTPCINSGRSGKFTYVLEFLQPYHGAPR